MTTRPTDPATRDGLVLDAFQREAIEAIQDGRSVLVAAPTGAGKTLIAEAAVERALADGVRLIYTSPIKALSNQKYRDFGERWPGQVGIVTGDVSLDADAPVLIMTTEIFRNAILEDPDRYADVGWCIFDEVHYLSDADRGTVWEESIIFAPAQIRLIGLSATIPNIEEIAAWIGEVRGVEPVVVLEHTRPVPLVYQFARRREGVGGIDRLKAVFPDPVKFRVGVARQTARSIIDHVVSSRRTPCLYFAFNRRECEAKAWRSMGRRLLSHADTERLAGRIEALGEQYGVMRQLRRGRLGELWGRGVAFHHAGMLPILKEIVERLFAEGLIRLLFATETFALGVNMPALTVVFDTLEKFDGIEFRPIRALEFQQMAGRAGRRGMDDCGYVYVNLDAVEQLRYRDLRQLLSGRVEPVTSQLNLGYSSILNLVQRHGSALDDAASRSLGRFQHLHRLRGRPDDAQARSRLEALDRAQRRVLDGRLALLTRTGFLDGDRQLTDKGRFASKINGYELQVTELTFGGELESLDAADLTAVIASLCFVDKKATWWDERAGRALRGVRKRVERAVRRLRRVESELGLPEQIQPPEFQIADVVRQWSRGRPLVALHEMTSLSDGDLIRTLRMTVQLLRQMHAASRGHDAFAATLSEAIDALRRDEVDAEAQLRRAGDQ